jgi:hypothetical protein
LDNLIFASRYLHRVYTGSAPGPHRVHTGSTPGLHRVYTGSTPGPHRVHTGFTPGLHRVYTGFTPGLHRVYTGSTPGLHPVTVLTRRSTRHHFASVFTFLTAAKLSESALHTSNWFGARSNYFDMSRVQRLRKP